MTFGTTWGNSLLDTIARRSDRSVRPLYLALHKEDPTVDGLAPTEFSGGSYQRQLVKFAQPAGKMMVNSEAVVFRGLRQNTLRYIALWDALNDGDMVAYGAIEETNIENGWNQVIDIGDFAVSI